MRCPHCQYENLPDSVFCPECGTRLERSCPHCGTENRLTSKFCRKCGEPLTGQSSVQKSSEFGVLSLQSPAPHPQPPLSYTPKHLAERIMAEQTAREAQGATDGERKTITALFADIKGSMNLIEDLDPEEARLMLTEIYGWFTEGFDTPDLKDAKVLLEELEGKATIASSKQRKTGRKGEKKGRRRSRMGMAYPS
jgi:hypothetical protein